MLPQALSQDTIIVRKRAQYDEIKAMFLPNIYVSFAPGILVVTVPKR